MSKGTVGKCELDILFLQDTLYAISGKWRLPIMAVIFNGAIRYSEILKSIPGLTRRMLSKELKELEMNKLVARTVSSSVPASVNYNLTPYSSSLEPLIFDLMAWGKAHRTYVVKFK